MPSAHILRSSAIVRTPRVMQLEGIFDVPPSDRSEERWTVDFTLPDEWNVGLIVGPSGSGKTTVAKELFEPYMARLWEWPQDKSLLDGFPAEMSIKGIVELLSSVGFSSPPLWMRPFHVLSNGEQFRVTMARTLAEMRDMAVMDEFSSVVDRTVAQIGSAAIAKTVRQRRQKFVAVSCHYDIVDWLEPDWVYQPHTNQFYSGRYLHQRPKIELTVQRVHHSAWALFRKYHYLDTELNKAARCFVAFWGDVPVGFVAIQFFPHPQTRKIYREHRLVCLPDYQGIGIGSALSKWAGACVSAMELRYRSITSHPAMIHARSCSSDWQTMASDEIGSRRSSGRGTLGSVAWKANRMLTRRTYAFEYIGAALPRDEAERVWSG